MDKHGLGLLHLLASQCCSIDIGAEIPEELAKAVDFTNMVYLSFLKNIKCGYEGGSIMAQRSLTSSWMFCRLAI